MKISFGMVVGLILITLGIFLGIVARLLVPELIIEFGFQIEVSVLVVLTGLLFGIPIYLLSYQKSRVQQEFDAKEHAITSEIEEERRQFIRRLDHELKNPLTAIQLQLDSLPEDVPSVNVTVDELRAQVQRLSRLTRGLRSLADLETRSLSLERIEVEELLLDVVALLDASDRVRLDIQETPWSPQPIEGDRELLLLAFRNLGQNGLNYSDGPVEIRARQRSDQLRVEFVDTGRGILAEDLPHIKDELYRGANVGEVIGSGLGLSIASRIIERHEGSLEITSRIDEGTIAAVELHSIKE